MKMSGRAEGSVRMKINSRMEMLRARAGKSSNHYRGCSDDVDDPQDEEDAPHETLEEKIERLEGLHSQTFQDREELLDAYPTETVTLRETVLNLSAINVELEVNLKEYKRMFRFEKLDILALVRMLFKQ